MLLRIKQNVTWKWFLYGAMVVQVASAIGTTVTIFTECKPFQSLWDPTIPGGYCSLIEIKESMYVNLSVNLIEDLIFSLLPLTFIRMMHVPLREKLVLTVVMGMGLLASAATIVRLTLIKGYGVGGDFSWDNSDMAMWAHLECNIGIAAACIPCLKSPFEKVLRRVGLLSPRDSTAAYRNQKYLPHSENVEMQSWCGSMQQGPRRAKPPYAHSQESILEEPNAGFTAVDHGIMKTTEVHLSSRAAEVED